MASVPVSLFFHHYFEFNVWFIVCLSYSLSTVDVRINWRASVASETLTGVTQSKIGDVSLFIYLFIYLASERSERDTYRGNTIENRGCLFIYLFICIYVWTYVCHFVL